MKVGIRYFLILNYKAFDILGFGGRGIGFGGLGDGFGCGGLGFGVGGLGLGEGGFGTDVVVVVTTVDGTVG